MFQNVGRNVLALGIFLGVPGGYLTVKRTFNEKQEALTGREHRMISAALPKMKTWDVERASKRSLTMTGESEDKRDRLTVTVEKRSHGEEIVNVTLFRDGEVAASARRSSYHPDLHEGRNVKDIVKGACEAAGVKTQW